MYENNMKRSFFIFFLILGIYNLFYFQKIIIQINDKNISFYSKKKIYIVIINECLYFHPTQINIFSSVGKCFYLSYKLNEFRSNLILLIQ